MKKNNEDNLVLIYQQMHSEIILETWL